MRSHSEHSASSPHNSGTVAKAIAGRAAVEAAMSAEDAGEVAAPSWPWPNFSRAEMACRHCAEQFVWPEFMDRLQAARTHAGRPFSILSAHRCALHNARVGGAPLSQHLRLAVDISLHGHDRASLLWACQKAGFQGFGFYTTFLHIDLGRSRQWYGNQQARNLWIQ